MKSQKLVILLFLSGCLKPGATSFTEIQTQPEGPNQLWVMTYNVENLFDTKDDPGKNDETYLPKKRKLLSKGIQKKCEQASRKRWVKECLETNWTTFKLKEKMNRLTEVVKSVAQGKGPDILILQEVENKNVLSQWNKTLGYQTMELIEGPDRRGIDVAVLSRLPIAKPSILHRIDFSKLKRNRDKKKKTRGILQTNLKLPNGKTLKVFALHFPSQGSKTPFRKAALESLNFITRDLLNRDLVLVGGDFNITKSEDKKFKLFKGLENKGWTVSHILGCKECKGTNFYFPKKSWSFFDAFLFNKLLHDQNGWEIDPNSIAIHNPLPVQNTKYDTPARFNMGRNPTGVSDHWPVVVKLRLVE